MSAYYITNNKYTIKHTKIIYTAKQSILLINSNSDSNKITMALDMNNHNHPSTSRQSSIIQEDETTPEDNTIQPNVGILRREQSTKSIISDTSSLSSYPHLPPKFQNRYNSNRSYQSRRRNTNISKASSYGRSSSHRRDFSFTSQYSLASTELPTPTPGSTRIQKQFFVRDEDDKEPDVIQVPINDQMHPTMSNLQPALQNTPSKQFRKNVTIALDTIDSPTPSMSTMTKSNQSLRSASARPEQSLNGSLTVESPHSNSLRRQSLLSNKISDGCFYIKEQ